MHIKVLIVDPDLASARQITAWIEAYGKLFQCITATNGKSAAEILKEDNIAVLITELLLPDLDGFGLLDVINMHTPEIPVIVVSSHGRPKTREILTRKGAENFFEKPLESKIFVAAFGNVVNRIQEGGLLKGASLDTFSQIIEMEQKTCTLRVFHPSTKGYGLLFFKNGEIVHARMAGGLAGIHAAYEVLAWQNVSLMIENQCKIQTHSIHADLQGVLMEAMRLKDEKLEQAEKDPAIEGAGSPNANKEVDFPNSETLENPLHSWLESTDAHALGVAHIGQDDTWQDLIAHMQNLGTLFDGGKMIACYLSAEDGSKSMIFPDKNAIMTLLPGCKREKIVRLVSENPPPFNTKT